MKIIVLASHTGSIFWFRIDMIKAFINRGHQVVAMGPESETKWKVKFLDEGIEYIQYRVNRNSLNPLDDVCTYYDLKKHFKRIKPDKIFACQAKSIVYGALAARVIETEFYSLIGGLGSIFRGEGYKNKFLRNIINVLYYIASKKSEKVFFQNTDDVKLLVQDKIVDLKKVVMLNGSGVNLKKFFPREYPTHPSFLFIGRLIKDKGILEYLEACRRIKQVYPYVRCLLVGPYDTNPSAINEDILSKYIDDGTIEYFGEQADVRPFIEQCTTYVLPSYHEGTPKTVLEAMAMGRSIITTDAPGCRETVKNNENGYLVPVGDVGAIVDRMSYLIEHPQESRVMGRKSAEIAMNKYDVDLVNDKIMRTMGLM